MQIIFQPVAGIERAIKTRMAGKAPVRYAVVDAFTNTPFKGNPGAVCLLNGDAHEGAHIDDSWMQSVAKEFNISETSFLLPIRSASGSAELQESKEKPIPRFHLRWFTPVAEVNLCGHGTLAAAHFLFSSGEVGGDVVEFDTKSGVLTAKKSQGLGHGNLDVVDDKERFSIELDFPVVSLAECGLSEMFPYIRMTLAGATIINTMKTAGGDLLVEVGSSDEVVSVQPQFEEIRNCPVSRGLILTGAAPPGSGFDFFTRFFCPKYGINEDPVCGSAHCALAPYWGEKLGKNQVVSYMASERSGILHLQLEGGGERVMIRGEAVTIMVGSLLV